MPVGVLQHTHAHTRTHAHAHAVWRQQRRGRTASSERQQEQAPNMPLSTARARGRQGGEGARRQRWEGLGGGAGEWGKELACTTKTYAAYSLMSPEVKRASAGRESSVCVWGGCTSAGRESRCVGRVGRMHRARVARGPRARRSCPRAAARDWVRARSPKWGSGLDWV